MNYETSDSNCRFDLDERRDLNKSHRFVIKAAFLLTSMYLFHAATMFAITTLEHVNV